MVWKVRAFALIMGLMLLAWPIQTKADTLYDEGNISTTYLSIFEDVLNGLPSCTDYVFFRSGQYEYTLTVGDLTYSNNEFSGSDVTRYILTYNSSGYNNSIYNYQVTDGTAFSLNCSNYLVYSNLGGYPTLIERGSSYEFTLLIAFVVFGICCLVRPVFNFAMRFSSGN